MINQAFASKLNCHLRSYLYAAKGPARWQESLSRELDPLLTFLTADQPLLALVVPLFLTEVWTQNALLELLTRTSASVMKNGGSEKLSQSPMAAADPTATGTQDPMALYSQATKTPLPDQRPRVREPTAQPSMYKGRKQLIHSELQSLAGKLRDAEQMGAASRSSLANELLMSPAPKQDKQLRESIGKPPVPKGRKQLTQSELQELVGELRDEGQQGGVSRSRRRGWELLQSRMGRSTSLADLPSAQIASATLIEVLGQRLSGQTRPVSTSGAESGQNLQSYLLAEEPDSLKQSRSPSTQVDAPQDDGSTLPSEQMLAELVTKKKGFAQPVKGPLTTLIEVLGQRLSGQTRPVSTSGAELRQNPQSYLVAEEPNRFKQSRSPSTQVGAPQTDGSTLPSEQMLAKLAKKGFAQPVKGPLAPLIEVLGQQLPRPYRPVPEAGVEPTQSPQSRSTPEELDRRRQQRFPSVSSSWSDAPGMTGLTFPIDQTLSEPMKEGFARPVNGQLALRQVLLRLASEETALRSSAAARLEGSLISGTSPFIGVLAEPVVEVLDSVSGISRKQRAGDPMASATSGSWSSPVLSSIVAADLLRILVSEWPGSHPPGSPSPTNETPPPEPIVPPAVQNTFNVTVHAAGGLEDETELADRLACILVEQARRHGIDVT